MLADTSDIHALSVAHERHAADLVAVAADLRSAQIDPDAFGAAGAAFLAALNAALTQEARQAAGLADRLVSAKGASAFAALSYAGTEQQASRAISALRA